MKSLLFIFILTFTFSFLTCLRDAQAQEIFRLGRSIRSAGMGNVHIPLATGTEALFYNPASLAKNPGLNFNFLTLGLGLNGLEAIDLITAGSSITSPSEYNQFFGKKVWLEAEGHLGITVPNFGVGYLTEYHATFELHNPGFPKFQTYFNNDNVTALGGGFSLGNKSFFGFTLKKIDRWGGDIVDLDLSTIANANSLASIGDNFANKGQGYGIDMAIMKEIEAPTSPTVSLVWQDVGNTAFQKTGGTTEPPHIAQNVSVGLGGGFDLPGLDWAYGIEANHLLETDIQAGKKIHLGTELSLPIIDLRAGINQGYMTYGIGINLLVFRIDAATYTEELGAYTGQSGQNRWLIGLSMDMSFDANFTLSDNDGKKRKLKRRR